MDLYVANIDKNYKNTWRTIYEAIDAPYFVEVKLFPKSFINQYKNHPNEPQSITSDIKKNIKILLEESLYAHVVRICRERMVQKKKTGKYLN